MNLQLFASLDDAELQNKVMQLFEGQGADPQAPTAAVETPEGVVTPTQEGNPAATESTVNPAAQTEPNAQTNATFPGGQPQGPQEQLIGGKFKSVDDLLNAYTNVESFATKKAQEAAQYKAMAEQIQNQQTQTQDPAQSAQAQQISPNDGVDPLDDNEALSELLYSDPAKVVQMIRDAAKAEAQAAVQPIQQSVQPLVERDQEAQAKAAWQEKVDAFSATHPDIDQWAPDMARILMDNPELRSQDKGLDIAYQAARGQKYAPTLDPAQLLSDQEFVKNNILSNPEIQKQIIQDYITQLQNGGQPLSIGQAPVGGNTPITPPKRPQSIEEAGEMALGWINKQK
jgi:hypothetical protein